WRRGIRRSYRPATAAPGLWPPDPAGRRPRRLCHARSRPPLAPALRLPRWRRHRSHSVGPGRGGDSAISASRASALTAAGRVWSVSGKPARGAAMLDPHRALIYTMVIVSAADSDMPDAELRLIGDIVGDLPVFGDFDRRELPHLLNDCTNLIGRED